MLELELLDNCNNSWRLYFDDFYDLLSQCYKSAIYAHLSIPLQFSDILAILSVTFDGNLTLKVGHYSSLCDQ